MLNKSTVTKEDLIDLLELYGLDVTPKGESSKEKTYPPMSFVPFDTTGPVPEAWIPRYTEQGPNGSRIYKHNKVGKFIMELTEAVRINGTLMFRNGKGTYVTDCRELFRIAQWLWDEATERQKREVVSYIMDKAKSRTMAPPYITGFQGEGDRDITYVDLRKLEIVPPEKEWFVFNIIPHSIPLTPDGKIDMDFKTRVCDEFLLGLASNDIEVVRQLEELIGYPFYLSNELRKFFILHGGRGNGKSTLQAAVNHLYGESNVIALSPAAIADKFGTSKLVGKMLNFGDDISNEYMSAEAVSRLKQITAGSYISVDKKYQDGFDFKPYSKIVYSCNDIPKFKDNTGALRDRMIIIPLHNYFDDDDPRTDTMLGWKMTENEENQQALLIHALRGVNRILTSRKFTKTEEGLKALREFELKNDHILEWANEFVVEANRSIINRRKEDVYNEFCSFARDNGYESVASGNFNDRLSKIFGLKDGRTPVTRFLDGEYKEMTCHVWKLDPSQAKTRELEPPMPPKSAAQGRKQA